MSGTIASNYYWRVATHIGDWCVADFLLHFVAHNRASKPAGNGAQLLLLRAADGLLRTGQGRETDRQTEKVGDIKYLF
jgi:hypothetical protein